MAGLFGADELAGAAVQVREAGGGGGSVRIAAADAWGGLGTRRATGAMRVRQTRRMQTQAPTKQAPARASQYPWENWVAICCLLWQQRQPGPTRDGLLCLFLPFSAPWPASSGRAFPMQADGDLTLFQKWKVELAGPAVRSLQSPPGARSRALFVARAGLQGWGARGLGVPSPINVEPLSLAGSGRNLAALLEAGGSRGRDCLDWGGMESSNLHAMHALPCPILHSPWLHPTISFCLPGRSDVLLSALAALRRIGNPPAMRSQLSQVLTNSAIPRS